MKNLSEFQELLESQLCVEELLKISGLFKSPDRTQEGLYKHSEILDQLFGFSIPLIERKLYLKAKTLFPSGNVQTWGHSLHNGNQTWIGLDPQTLQTPYDEIWEMLNFLNLNQGHFIDLGAGYGRMALVLHQLFPECRFTGYEFLEERVNEGNRIYKNVSHLSSKLLQQDLMAPDFQLPLADVYFLYDFGKVSHIRHIMGQLSEIADKNSFKVIARGKGVRSVIDLEHPWLSQVFKPHHRPHYSIYSMS